MRPVQADLGQGTVRAGPSFSEIRGARNNAEHAASRGEKLIVLPGRRRVQDRDARHGGRGLDSEWRGDLRITGTVDAPQIAGSIRTVRGRYDLLGRRVATLASEQTLETGQLLLPLDGSPPEWTSPAHANVRGPGYYQ